MKTNEYVKQFKLDRENYNFNREKFMEAFGQEFKDRIEAMITACQKMKERTEPHKNILTKIKTTKVFTKIFRFSFITKDH